MLADDFWSFVHYCRRGKLAHGREIPGKMMYDAVIGPVASSWQKRQIQPDSDQISFHTLSAKAILDGSARTVVT